MRLNSSLIALSIIVMIVGALTGLLLPSADHDFTHHYPPASSRRGNELAGVAGEYYLGNGRGTNLRLSVLPDGRYSFVSSGCTGVGYRESGHARQTDGHYVLSPTGPSEPGVERTLDLIRWDRRRYLIPPAKIQEFRDAIVGGREPRVGTGGWFYLRVPIEPADGLPDSPESGENDLRKDLLVGRVLEVSAVGLAKVGRARVDLGAERGLREGDVLTVQRRGDAHHRHFTVVSVDVGSCEADETFPESSGQPLESGQAVVWARMRQGTGRR